MSQHQVTRLSPAAAHRQRVLAASAVAKAPAGPIAARRPESGPEASAYELLRAQLGEDLAALKTIASVELKIARKAEMIGKYRDHVIATLKAAQDSGKALQDDIVTTMMIWLFDIGEWDDGLIVAHHVLKFGLSLPENIVRKAPVLIAEEVAEGALKALSTDNAFDLKVVVAALELTAKEDMPDQVRAKLFKARGRLLMREAACAADNADSGPAGAAQAALSSALASLRRALELDKKSGVKKDIEQLERKVAAEPEQ